jgi:hypothetical protein
VVVNTRTFFGLPVALSLAAATNLRAQNPLASSVPVKSSYQFPVAEEGFASFFERISADKRVLMTGPISGDRVKFRRRQCAESLLASCLQSS